MLPEMPKNSESQMLSAVIKWMKINLPEKLFLYTWADGIVGKCGYVYQSANFLYGGFIWTDIYIGPDGEKIHQEHHIIFVWKTPNFVIKKKCFG